MRAGMQERGTAGAGPAGAHDTGSGGATAGIGAATPAGDTGSTHTRETAHEHKGLGQKIKEVLQAQGPGCAGSEGLRGHAALCVCIAVECARAAVCLLPKR